MNKAVSKAWAFTQSSWVTMLFGATIGLIGGGGIARWYWSRPAVVVISSYEDDNVAFSGGDLEFINTKVDNNVCQTSVARWLWRLDPTDPLPDSDPRKRRQWRAVISTPFGPPSIGKISTYRLSVPLPDHIEPGYWHPLNESIDTCSSLTQSAPRFIEGKPILIKANPADSAAVAGAKP